MGNKEDFQKLIDGALPFAKRMLQSEGEFIPFGAQLSPNGDVSLVAGDVGEEHPESSEVIGLLTQTFAKGALARQIRAAAICFMASTPQPDEHQDFAVVRMSHIDGETMDVYLPYVVEGRSEVSFKPLVASAGRSNFLMTHFH